MVDKYRHLSAQDIAQQQEGTDVGGSDKVRVASSGGRHLSFIDSIDLTGSRAGVVSAETQKVTVVFNGGSTPVEGDGTVKYLRSLETKGVKLPGPRAARAARRGRRGR